MSIKRSGEAGSAPNRQICEEAARWFVEINEGEPSHTTRARFDEWLRLSPEHLRAYLRIVPVWEQGALLETHARMDTAALIAWAKEDDNVVPLGVRPSTGPRRRLVRLRAPWRLALVASLGAVAVASSFWLWMAPRETYETATGEQRVIGLSDGSRIELNSRSRIRVRFTGRGRDVDLIEGQALFRVAHDMGRPFVVHSGETLVRAVGTEFDVYKKPAAVVVTVVEGRVTVSSLASLAPLNPSESASSEVPVPLMLSAGEQAVVTGSSLPKPTSANVGVAIAWTQQRLEFSHTPLVEVVEEFNRYNKRKVVVKAGELADFQVSGNFSSSDPTSLVRFLRSQPGVRVDESDAEFVISKE